MIDKIIDFSNWDTLVIKPDRGQNNVRHRNEIYIRDGKRGGKIYKALHASPDLYNTILTADTRFDIKVGKDMFVVIVSEDGLYKAGKDGHLGGNALGMALIEKYGSSSFDANRLDNIVLCTPRKEPDDGQGKV